MFDFTTTTFVHSADMIEANPGNTQNFLRIGNATFKYEDVVAIYRNPYVNPANAKLYVDVASFMTAATTAHSDAKRFKLDFYLKRSGDANSLYSNAFVFKGKDFHYEWTSKQTDAKSVAKIINKIIRLYGDVFLKVSVEKVKNVEMLVFESDNYGVFTEAQLKVYVPEVSDCCTYREGDWDVMDELTGEERVNYDGQNCCDDSMKPYISSDKKLGGSGEGWLTAWQGVNGFGTYEQIIKDLRLPTMENFRWGSPTASEMPIPGNKYVQYIIHQVSCRGVLGGSAVGEVTHSKTTHVFFVPACGCDAESGNLDTAMWTAIDAAGMGNLILSTDGATFSNGAISDPTLKPDTENGGTTSGTIVSDKVTPPAIAEEGKFVHDPETKAVTANTNEHPHESESTPDPKPEP